ncbi:hypothetical protein L1887_29343 [Cichorium endivia]|nr:hypothetical protein L1887_29343 [Cichorium endivia]
MSEDYFQVITGLNDNNPSITPATGRFQRSKLGVLGLAWKLFLLPISIIGGSLGLVTGSIGLSLWVAGFFLSYWLNMIGFTSSGRNRKPSSTPPVSVSVSAAAGASEARNFLSEFESRYGIIHPDFVPGRFIDAVERSGRECKLLFVYLHSPDHPDTPSFCNETLCSEFLSAFVNDNFVSWGDSIQEKEGLEISMSLNASRFPFWAVIMATTGESTFSLLRQFEGPSSPEEMLTELQTVLEENAPAIVAATVDTSDEETNDTPFREEEDAPSGSALETHQANECQEKEDQNGTEIEADSEAKLSEEEAPPFGSKIEAESEAELSEEEAPPLGSKMESENEADLIEEEAPPLGFEPEQDPDVIQVLVRLPTGDRIGRIFPCTATLQSVYEFVDSSDCLDIGSYTLVNFFPRVLYGQDQLSSTLQELGLPPQTSLFVELNW